MSQFDMGAMAGLLGGFQQKVADMRAKAAQTEVEGSAGGIVTVRCTCDFQVTSVRIDPAAGGDVEMLEDLIRAATNEALRNAQDEMQRQMAQLTAGLPIPPGMIPGL